MKIDQDLRAAIRSAEKTQPSYGYQEKERQEDDAIKTFLAKYPPTAKAIAKLRADSIRHFKAFDAAREELCKRFGLRLYGDANALKFAHCDDGKKAFIKAGGKLATKRVQWRFDSVMAELAAAEPKQLTAILKKYGINWK